MTTKATFSIGQAAQHTGVSAHTLRYYEKIALLGPIAKNASGQRSYQTSDIQRIQFIKRAQAMQFSLQEIKQLINLDQSSDMPKPEAQTMVKDKLSLIDERLRELQDLKVQLSQLLSACENSNKKEKCPILEGIKK